MKLGKLVPVLFQSGDNKQSKWVWPQTVQRFDAESGATTVSSSSSFLVHAAFEGVCGAIWDNLFAAHVIETYV